jgi:hypothetical protein
MQYYVSGDRLLQLHMLNQTEEDNDISWGCHKVVDHFKEKRYIIAKKKEMVTIQVIRV